MPSLRCCLLLTLVILALLPIAPTIYGLTEPSSAGLPAARTLLDDGEGYTVTNIRYTLDQQDPTKIAKVAFLLSDLPSDPVRVHAKLVHASTRYSLCAHIPETQGWECAVQNLSIKAADQLGVRVERLAPAPQYAIWISLLHQRTAQHSLYLPVLIRHREYTKGIK